MSMHIDLIAKLKTSFFMMHWNFNVKLFKNIIAKSRLYWKDTDTKDVNR